VSELRRIRRLSIRTKSNSRIRPASRIGLLHAVVFTGARPVDRKWALLPLGRHGGANRSSLRKAGLSLPIRVGNPVWPAGATYFGTTSGLPTIRELSGRLHFLSVGRYAVKVRPLLVDNIRFRLVNKPGCQHEKIGACVPLTISECN